MSLWQGGLQYYLHMNDLDRRVNIKCLEKVKALEEDQNEKDTLDRLLKKLERAYNRSQLAQLKPQQKKWHLLLIDGFHAYKEAFVEITKIEKFKVVAETEGFELNDYLLSLQPLLALARDNPTIDHLQSKYTVLHLKLKKQYENWPKELFSEWATRSKEKMKKFQAKRNQAIISKPAPRQPEYSESEEPSQQIRPARIVQRIEPERKIQQRQKPRKTEYIRQAEKVETIKEPKAKIFAMEKYLESRKDLFGDKIDKVKLRQVSQFLTAKLDAFMKKTIEKVIDIAALKNRKNMKTGNELGYFSSEQERVQPETPFYISPNSKIFALQYKHKLQIYGQLRKKEFRKEDELRSNLEMKTGEGDKRTDRRVETYLLKPRPPQVPPLQIFSQRDQTQVSRLSGLTVGADHLIYYLQQHPFLRNSLLLFNAYHY